MCNNEKNIGGEACYNIVKEEYIHIFDKSDKLDNKIHISLTFYAFIFAFMMSLLENILEFKFPTDIGQLILVVIYIITCLIAVSLFIYTLLKLVNLLKPFEIKTFNQDFIVNNNLQHKDPNSVYSFAAVKYTQAINSNNEKLEQRFIKYKQCLTNITWIVVLSFILNIINMFITKRG